MYVYAKGQLCSAIVAIIFSSDCSNRSWKSQRSSNNIETGSRKDRSPFSVAIAAIM